MLCILCNFRWSSFTGFILPSHPCLHPCSSGADTSAQGLLWHQPPSFTLYEHQLMEGGSKTQNGWNHTAAHQRNRSWKYTLYPMTGKLSLLHGWVFGLLMYLPVWLLGRLPAHVIFPSSPTAPWLPFPPLRVCCCEKLPEAISISVSLGASTSIRLFLKLPDGPHHPTNQHQHQQKKKCP